MRCNRKCIAFFILMILNEPGYSLLPSVVWACASERGAEGVLLHSSLSERLNVQCRVQ